MGGEENVVVGGNDQSDDDVVAEYPWQMEEDGDGEEFVFEDVDDDDISAMLLMKGDGESDSKVGALFSSLQKLLDDIGGGQGEEKKGKALKQRLKEAKAKLTNVQGKMKKRVTAMRRKVITGSSDKRVRDFIKEAPVVKTIDKVSFTLGVMMLLLVEYMALERPAQFGVFYSCLLVPLLLARWNLYVKEKFQYFLIDFCYFLNLSCVICTFYPNVFNGVLIRACFVMANGVCLCVCVFVFVSVSVSVSV